MLCVGFHSILLHKTHVFPNPVLHALLTMWSTVHLLPFIPGYWYRSWSKPPFLSGGHSLQLYPGTLETRAPLPTPCVTSLLLGLQCVRIYKLVGRKACPQRVLRRSFPNYSPSQLHILNQFHALVYNTKLGKTKAQKHTFPF